MYSFGVSGHQKSKEVTESSCHLIPCCLTPSMYGKMSALGLANIRNFRCKGLCKFIVEIWNRVWIKLESIFFQFLFDIFK